MNVDLLRISQKYYSVVKYDIYHTNILPSPVILTCKK